jgi:hypothetical protein
MSACPVSVLVSVGYSFCVATVRSAARIVSHGSHVNTGDFRCAAVWFAVVPDCIETTAVCEAEMDPNSSFGVPAASA